MKKFYTMEISFGHFLPQTNGGIFKAPYIKSDLNGFNKLE